MKRVHCFDTPLFVEGVDICPLALLYKTVPTIRIDPFLASTAVLAPEGGTRAVLGTRRPKTGTHHYAN